MPNLVANNQGKVRKPGTKMLEDVLELNNEQSFVDFIEVSKFEIITFLYFSVVLTGTQKQG
jgi:uncharacterized membrane protein